MEFNIIGLVNIKIILGVWNVLTLIGYQLLHGIFFCETWYHYHCVLCSFVRMVLLDQSIQ